MQQYSDVLQFVCGVCGYHHCRKRSLNEHFTTKKCKSTHPLGLDTPYTRVMLSPIGKCNCDFCIINGRYVVAEEPVSAVETVVVAEPVSEVDPVVIEEAAIPSKDTILRSSVSSRRNKKDNYEFMTKETDKSVLVSKISRCTDELLGLIRTIDAWVPAYRFGKEPVPAPVSIPSRLLDIFTRGVEGLVAHCVWTHVHSCGNVKTSSSADHLAVYGIHGWSSTPILKVAEDAYNNIPQRIEKMWFALESKDQRALNTLKTTARSFLKEHGSYVDIEPRVFGFMDMSQQPLCLTAKNKIIEMIALSMKDSTSA